MSEIDIGCQSDPALHPLLPSPQPSPLPCLDSSSACVDQLTEAAIARNTELDILNQRIAVIHTRIRKTKAGSVSDWVDLNPIGFAQNAVQKS